MGTTLRASLRQILPSAPTKMWFRCLAGASVLVSTRVDSGRLTRSSASSTPTRRLSATGTNKQRYSGWMGEKVVAYRAAGQEVTSKYRAAFRDNAFDVDIPRAMDAKNFL